MKKALYPISVLALLSTICVASARQAFKTRETWQKVSDAESVK